MKPIAIIGLVLVATVLPGVCSAKAPHELAGFVLDRPISEFEDRVIMETALPVRYFESFYEVEIKPLKGYKSGLIGYGTCARPGNIVRIKLKYEDSSREFFDNLLKEFKKRFGEPDEYQGDPFQVLISWKWSFVDEQNNRISLVLQHNQLDEDEKMGNAVKLTMTSLADADMRCFQEKHAGQEEQLRQRRLERRDSGVSGWDLYVPR
jgi:hypothetical protein